MMRHDELACAYAWPRTPAVLRMEPADFRVVEELGFEPDGAGEHLWLQVEKTALTTPQAAREVARLLGIAPRQVSWSGLKDRNAVTVQWLSAHLPGREAAGLEELQRGAVPGLRLLRAARHGRKLRPGTHRRNHFEIRLHDCHADAALLAQRLAQVALQGVPNYFGPQRFGNEASNLETRRRGRQGRAMHLSALRALLFNAVLDARVRAGNWNRVLPGDVLQFADGNSVFVASSDGAGEQARVDAGELHVTGPLAGTGEVLASAETAQLEQQVLAGYPEPLRALERERMKPARRALRLLPEDMQWESGAAGEVRVSFSLRSGAYATVLLREVFLLDDARGREAA